MIEISPSKRNWVQKTLHVNNYSNELLQTFMVLLIDCRMLADSCRQLQAVDEYWNLFGFRQAPIKRQFQPVALIICDDIEDLKSNEM